ncbi:hypothetical protein GUJ93_ZPchr0010g10480 [Zizania palustris]|uniref:C2 domain-containing protein n=1 Tax=Zizania palustris TaxID=103762 RepID=A0A8J6BMN7_ZIZPA|nr:hypothetical protein GUJ93_ZPchr0010g10480 [Zizania palustris]
MGGCLSGDVRGGMEAVGGGGSGLRGTGQGGANEAVDHFFQKSGLRGLYSPLELSFSASKLKNMDVLSKSDPMLVIYTKKDRRLEEIGRTEVILNSLEPSWITKATINYQFEIVQPLVFQIYDIDTRYRNTPVKMLNLSQQDFLGEACCNLSEIVTKFNHSLTLNLQSSSGHALLGTVTVHAEESDSSRIAVEMTLHCLNLETKTFFPKLTGQLFVDKFLETVQHTFLDYISSGFELNFMVAVDFTASNGDPRAPQSLHYIDPSGRPNSYQQAILGVGEVLQFYDNDRRFPAWGFGAKTPQGYISHCFNLNATTNDCEVRFVVDEYIFYTFNGIQC